MGTVSEPVPVTGFALNFSPMPRIAPPPLGSVIAGAVNSDDAGPDVFSEEVEEAHGQTSTL